MADDTTTAPAGEQSTEQAEPEEKTFTQTEVNHLIEQRIGRVKAKYADYDELKQQAETAAKAQDTLNALKEENESLKSTLDQTKKETERAGIRAQVAQKYGISDPSVLIGESEEDITAFADKLLHAVNGASEVAHARSTQAEGTAPKSGKAAFISQMEENDN